MSCRCKTGARYSCKDCTWQSRQYVLDYIQPDCALSWYKFANMESSFDHCSPWRHRGAHAEDIATGDTCAGSDTGLMMPSTVHSLNMTVVQYCEPTRLAAVEQAVSNQINTAKLLAVEKLLWGHTPRKPGEGKQGKHHHSKHQISADIAIYSELHLYHICAGLGSRMRARVVHRLLVVGAQYISFEAANLQLVYKQDGMPGPRPTPDSPLAGMDAVCLDVRKISLEPQGIQTVPPRCLSVMCM